MEDTKRIRFSNMAKFMFNEDQAIIFNRLNGQWIKVPKQCYDILELCNKEGLSWSALSESLADDEDREYMKQLIKLLDSMNCLYNDDEKIIENISFAITCAVIRGKGVFEKVVSSIKLLQSHGFSKISISMVLSANNVRYTKQFIINKCE